jgi:hypothetical protein
MSANDVPGELGVSERSKQWPLELREVDDCRCWLLAHARRLGRKVEPGGFRSDPVAQHRIGNARDSLHGRR